MTRTKKILSVTLVVVAIGVLSLGVILSHDSACGPAPALPDNAQLMKAIVHRCYGPPDVLKFEDIEKPVPADNEVLVKVHAAAVNPLDWHYMRGTPYIMRMEAGFGAPKNPRLGVDFAGTVEAVGKDVKGFKHGDEVFGGKYGAFAEYVSVREDRALALKPANVTFEQAASVAIAAVTAFRAV
jgi:NADPH:quinone reductase-like Zn-dependent oxidoreductase